VADDKTDRVLVMNSITSYIIIGALIIIAASGIFLATWEIPVPETIIERNISIPTAKIERKITE
tara:strand:+ start:116 stop:307 length:192 start_codon:yes stop_codon:yes gene_type:complete